MQGQRYVILGSAIVAAILTPTPDPLNQLIMALPVILLYQLSIIILWVVNMRKNPATETTSQNFVVQAPLQPTHTPVNANNISSSTPALPKLQPQPRKFMDISPPTRTVIKTLTSVADEVTNEVAEVIEKPRARSMDFLTS